MSQYDVLCIGNAIVDIIAQCDDAFLTENRIIKGAMNLIDAERAELLYSRMGPAIEASGGSAGNTAAGVASFGGRSAYFGKVSRDHLGQIFTHDIHAQGVAFDTSPLIGTPPTARSMIFVTPDGERSMNTYLGACVELGPDDVEADKASGAKVTYFEGYLWDPPLAKEAIRLTAGHAHAAGREVSMTLSDPFCVDRYRDEFLDLMRTGTVDIVFANESEAKSLYQTESFEQALPGKLAPYHNDGRWLYRSRAIFNGSFYAAIGEERTRLKELFDKDRPDVILCNFGDIAMRLLPTAREAGIPLVAYFHGDFSFIRNRWYRWSLYRCLHDFAAIVVVTDAERQWLREHGAPEDKIHYIPCGALTDVFRPVPERSDDLVRFVMVSRLSEEKGCDVSIRAFSEVAKQNPKVRLGIFGDGVERENLGELVKRLGLVDKVTFHGFIDELSLAKKLPLHDIFIQHSRIKEGSPVSIVEAMSCALPVVATTIGGITDQIATGQNGYLVSEGDIDGMIAAMQRLASDPVLRKQLGAVGRDRAVACHDAAKQTRRLGELVMDVTRASSMKLQGALAS